MKGKTVLELIICRKCGEEFRKLKDYEKHMKEKHKKSEINAKTV